MNTFSHLHIGTVYSKYRHAPYRGKLCHPFLPHLVQLMSDLVLRLKVTKMAKNYLSSQMPAFLASFYAVSRAMHIVNKRPQLTTLCIIFALIILLTWVGGGPKVLRIHCNPTYKIVNNSPCLIWVLSCALIQRVLSSSLT